MVHPPPSQTPDERRWAPGAWITLALGYLLGGGAYVLAAYAQPSDGWNTVYSAPTCSRPCRRPWSPTAPGCGWCADDEPGAGRAGVELDLGSTYER